MRDGNKLVVVVVLAAGLAPVVSACGGDGGGSCGNVAPCGGSVAGTWNVSGACFKSSTLDATLGAECAGATVALAVTQISGTVALNGDLTYATTTTAALALQEALPPACLQAVGLTCAALDQQFKQMMATDPTILSAGCTGSGTCICSLRTAPRTSSETGTYTTSGTTLTLTASDGSSESNEYCLQGNELHVMALDPAMPIDAMGRPNVQAETVLTRR